MSKASAWVKGALGGASGKRCPPLALLASGKGATAAILLLPSRLREGSGVGIRPRMDGQFQPRDTPRARELRNAATPAERTLWRCLSRRKVAGWKFSRQMPVGPYFADFLCREAHLVIDLDGHSQAMAQKNGSTHV